MNTLRPSLIPLVAALLFTFAGCTGNAPQEAALYVAVDGSDTNSGAINSPFATPARAAEELRKMRASGTITGPVTVYLREGVHELDETFALTAEDSGTKTAPVTFRSYPGESAVISGGYTPGTWSEDTDGVWTLPLEKTNTPIRFLYIDGERRSRPRMPREGYYRIADFPLKKNPVWNARNDWFIYADGDIDPGWKNLTDIEVISPRSWVSSRQKIASLDTETNRITFRDSTRYRYSDDHTANGARYYLENVAEALDEPGEWYYDTSAETLSYIPMPGETPSTVECVIPRVSRLINMTGEPLENRFVEYVNFRDLTFSYNNWHLPDGNVGDGQSAPEVEGAVLMKGTRRCSFFNCRLTNLSSYAVQIDEGCTFNSFAHNELGSLGGGGFRIGGGSAYDHPLLRTGNNTIADNHIHHIGLTHHAATGIWIQHSFGNHIEHNHIHHTYYSSIAIGWVWGYTRSISKHNIIEYNHIHDVGQGMLSDMGGIYLLGEASGTVVRNNLFHDIQSHGYGGWGIYTDEGSSDVLIENNIVYNTKCGGFHQHYGCENVIRNNIFADSAEGQIIKSRVEPHLTIVFENNIVYWKEGPLLGGNWSGADIDIYNPFGRNKAQGLSCEFDYNCYYNSAGKPFTFSTWTFDEWKARGRDVHSIIADPMFADPENGDFTLSENSPALKLGFVPIDISTVGPREMK